MEGEEGKALREAKKCSTLPGGLQEAFKNLPGLGCDIVSFRWMEGGEGKGLREARKCLTSPRGPQVVFKKLPGLGCDKVSLKWMDRESDEICKNLHGLSGHKVSSNKSYWRGMVFLPAAWRSC